MQLHVHHAASDLPRPDESPANCRRCALWKGASQAVVGEGPRGARLMLVGGYLTLRFGRGRPARWR